MDDDQLTQATQGTQDVMDPRRMGMNNSGLAPEDVSDVMCILHPSTPAAFELVAETARRTPQHILQDVSAHHNDHATTPSMLEEEDTFILEANRPNASLDLAFRFSSKTIQPQLGFVLGRNMGMCDIVVSSDAHKRVSNMHFAIYMNDQGVLMLKDLSTNGTMVDETLLKGKHMHYEKTRMLNHGSIVQILSPSPEEAIKFIVRMPSRVGYLEEFEAKFHDYMMRLQELEMRHRGEEGNAPKQGRQANTSVKAPIVQNQYGMHWNGGDTYNVVGQIGKGAFASVYQLATKAEGHLFAAKELEKRKFMKNGVLDRKLENEMLIMQSINHPSIVQYHEYMDAANHLYIIMEYVPCGDLQQYLTLTGPLSEHVGKQMATQVFDALDYLHNKRITHRDIKPDNILIGCRDANNFIIKLSDFGLSKVVKDNDTFLKTFCGTLLYCAPEVFPHYDAHVSSKGTKRPRKPPPQQSKKFHSYSQAVDIWSFGAVLWYSLCHKPPFEGVADNTGRGMFDKIMMTPLDAIDLVKQGVSDEAVALLVQMLNTDPSARPSAEDCLRHEWFGNQKFSPKRQSQPLLELGDIEEEVEAELGADEEEDEPDVAALSLDEREKGSQNSEVSLNSSDLNFFDPRKSKRFKTNNMDNRQEDEEELLDSSPELLYDSIPIMHQEDGRQAQPGATQQARRPKLFGEISQSDLQRAVHDRRTNTAADNNTSSTGSEEQYVSDRSQQNAQRFSSGEYGPSPSLFGAESMVRDMNMDSRETDDVEDDEDDGPATPSSHGSIGGQGEANPPEEPPAANAEETPRAAHDSPFNRQINIPLPPSFYYIPHDPSTHTVEYASRVSGRDFAAEIEQKTKQNHVELPTQMPDTAHNSRDSDDLVDSAHPKPHEIPAEEDDVAANEAGPRPALGRLVSTLDSFKRVVLDIDAPIMTWGRGPDNTYVYPNKSDVRIPRTAIAVFFHGDGIEKDMTGETVAKLSSLYCGILTHGSNGLSINGVQLERGDPGKYLFGRIHTGDEIEVFPPTREGKKGLMFRAEIYHGEGKYPRSTRGPRFKVEKENTKRTKSRSRSTGAVAAEQEQDGDDEIE